jgi:hypothetical protein
MNPLLFAAVTLCMACALALCSYVERAEERGDDVPDFYAGGWNSTAGAITIVAAYIAFACGLAHGAWWALLLCFACTFGLARIARHVLRVHVLPVSFGVALVAVAVALLADQALPGTDVDCDDFAGVHFYKGRSYSSDDPFGDAQHVLENSSTWLAGDDPHDLDGDGDGIACENLRGQQRSTTVERKREEDVGAAIEKLLEERETQNLNEDQQQ